ncbi:hypothetical protein I546_4157 [Mycobacterium kansasii 732]|nr:hypothetical protein I546_4157 [Mycobacterium kansasii 732]
MLDSKDAYLHVVYDYRYLALAGAGRRLYGPGGHGRAIESANALLPGIGVLLLDSLLIHARALIEFFMTADRRDTDIRLSDFDGLVIDQQRRGKLEKFKKPVEVHVLHLTAWRDVAYRAGNTKNARPYWDTEAIPLVELLLDALLDASAAAAAKSKWERPFQQLHHAATNLLADCNFAWPPHLTEKEDVMTYLAGEGIH